MSQQKITAETIKGLLANKYSDYQYVFLTEVTNSNADIAGEWGQRRDALAGRTINRIIDAIAINTWPSTGFETHGFEIKVNRSDWISELDNPRKAEAFKKYCDRWYLVAPAGVAEKHEIPPDWGYMQATPKTLRRMKIAPKADKKESFSTGLATYIMRRAFHHGTSPQDFRDQVDLAVSKEHSALENEIAKMKGQIKQYKEVGEEIYNELGIKLVPRRWGGEMDKEKVKEILGLVSYIQDDYLFEGHTQQQDFSVVKRNIDSIVDKLPEIELALKVIKEKFGKINKINKPNDQS